MIVAVLGAYFLGGFNPKFPIPASSWTNWAEYSVCWEMGTQVSLREWEF